MWNEVTRRQEMRRLELERVETWMPQRRSTRVLELGCGDGYLASLLMERYPSYYPTDIDPVRNSLGNLKIVCSAGALPFENAVFDFDLQLSYASVR